MPIDYDDEDDDKFRASDLTKPWNLAFIIVVFLFVVSLWYPAKPTELVEVNGFTIMMSIGLFGMLSYKGTIAMIKYASPQLITQTVHGSTSGDPVVSAGIWHAYTLGDLYILSPILRGNEGTVIVPKSHIDKNTGRNRSIPCWVEEVTMEEIPYDIQPLVLNNRHCKPPYYVAWFSPTLEHLLPQAALYREQIKRLSE